MNYKSIPEFDRDLKKLLKRFTTLEADIETAKKNAIELFHLRKLNNLSVFPVTGYGETNAKIFKIKKFTCKDLKGRGVHSGIRMIYAYYEMKQEVVFIQIYFKADQENEDYQRIKDYLKNQDA